MIKQTVPYGDYPVSKVEFPQIIVTVTLTKFEFVTSIVRIKYSDNSVKFTRGTHVGS